MKRIVREDDGNTFEVDTKWTQIVKFIKNDWREFPVVFMYLVVIVFGAIFYWIPVTIYEQVKYYFEAKKSRKSLSKDMTDFCPDEEAKEIKHKLNYGEFSNAFLTGVAVVSLLVIGGLIWLVFLVF